MPFKILPGEGIGILGRLYSLFIHEENLIENRN